MLVNAVIIVGWRLIRDGGVKIRESGRFVSVRGSRFW
jgi:hypothetical protein